MDVKWAKEHFLKYDGSYFHMTREGDIRRYKEYGISREQEKEWIRARQQDLIQKIETEKNIVPLVSKMAMRLCLIIMKYKEMTYLSSLVNALKKKEPYLDSFSLLRVSEDILQLVEHLLKESIGENSSVLEAKQFAIELLHKVINNPITIDSWYTEKSGYLKDLTEKEVLERAKALLRRWA